MAANKAKLIETANTDYLRASRRINKQNVEVALATGAQRRAQARLDAAKAKVANYWENRVDAQELLLALGAEVPEFVFDDVEIDEDPVPVEDQDPESTDDAPADENPDTETEADAPAPADDENRDVLV